MKEAMHHLPIDRAAMVKLMRAHRISPTQQRVDIAMVLFEKQHHFSADQILAIVNQQGEHVSKATVYNTLGLFARKGLIREVFADPSRIFYDSNVAAHHHFYNADTGELIDFDASEITLGGLPSLPQGTIAEGVDVVIRVRNNKG